MITICANYLGSKINMYIFVLNKYRVVIPNEKINRINNKIKRKSIFTSKIDNTNTNT